ncbi:2668_t:CDS:2 [Ambispora leptoticha]|uniref:2668_t:CDS:1 n=1 Tax=Ambispora leptoticha TaxID=144679 RepID=A0A9N9BBU4_9GLOM|nr:2668_t:CDS:2 [Ambispora leptoticha]
MEAGSTTTLVAKIFVGRLSISIRQGYDTILYKFVSVRETHFIPPSQQWMRGLRFNSLNQSVMVFEKWKTKNDMTSSTTRFQNHYPRIQNANLTSLLRGASSFLPQPQSCVSLSVVPSPSSHRNHSDDEDSDHHSHNHRKSVQFSRFLVVHETWCNDEYDRTSMEPARLNFKEYSELLQLRCDLRREMEKMRMMAKASDSENDHSVDDIHDDKDQNQRQRRRQSCNNSNSENQHI